MELQLSISPSNEYSGLISFRFDWFDLLGVQGPAAPQFKSISSSELSLLYGPTVTSLHDYWKNHSFRSTDLCRQSDVFAFKYAVWICHSFPSKEQGSLISWLQSLSSVILEPKKIKSVIASTLSLHDALPILHDFWKNHSFDYMDLCQQSDVPV